MEEWKIGEIRQVNGEWYQCVVAIDGCRECSFRAQDYCTRHSECFSYIRSDGISVIFKKLEKVGEPITVDGKNVQLLKTTIANCDNCAFYKDVNCDFTCYPRKCHGGEEGTYVEIKQNKEDMEEKKLNLKPFDIQKAREGKPVCTRDGRKARIICFDGKGDQPIIALVEAKGNKDALIEKVERYFINGHSVFEVRETNNDLMMLPEKKEGWVNVYKGIDGITFSRHPHISKEKAIEEAGSLPGRIDTVKVFWEE